MAGLWSLLRAAFAIFPIYQILISLNYYAPTAPGLAGPNYYPEWLRQLLYYWKYTAYLNSKFEIVIQVLLLICFLYAAIGIVLGHAWARTLFLAISILAVARFTIVEYPYLLGFLMRLGDFIASMASLALALWYFRRPDVLAWFGIEGVRMHWLDAKISRVPVTLAVGLLLVGIILVADAVSIIYDLPMDFFRSLGCYRTSHTHHPNHALIQGKVIRAVPSLESGQYGHSSPGIYIDISHGLGYNQRVCLRSLYISSSRLDCWLPCWLWQPT